MQDITVAEDYISGVYEGVTYYIAILWSGRRGSIVGQFIMMDLDKFVEELSSQDSYIFKDNGNIFVKTKGDEYFLMWGILQSAFDGY